MTYEERRQIQEALEGVQELTIRLNALYELVEILKARKGGRPPKAETQRIAQLQERARA